MESQPDLTIMIERSNMKMYSSIVFISSRFVGSTRIRREKKIRPSGNVLARTTTLEK